MDKILTAMKAMSVKYTPKEKFKDGLDIVDKRLARKLASQFSLGGKRLTSSSEVIQAVNKLNEAE